MKLISIVEAARLLGTSTQTLRRHETEDGRWAIIYGHRIHVYRIGFLPSSQRRYDEDEIRRVLSKMQRVR